MSEPHEAPVEAPEPPLSPETAEFYRRAMEVLDRAGLPFLVGGAYAFARYTGIVRHTKDFDIFVRRRDFEPVLAALAAEGFRVEHNFPHWLGKAWHGDDFVDVIFSSGNGVAKVDDRWFEHAVGDEVLGMPARLCPAEEMIWSKAFIMERERFDGADVAHLILRRGEALDWDRLLERFGDNFRVLLAHVLLFGYIYPGERRTLTPVLDRLLARLGEERAEPRSPHLCRGTVLSRSQYLVDIEQWGFEDARLRPVGRMSVEEIEIWTEAAEREAAEKE